MFGTNLLSMEEQVRFPPREEELDPSSEGWSYIEGFQGAVDEAGVDAVKGLLEVH